MIARILVLVAYCVFPLLALAQTTPSVLVNGNTSQQIQLNLGVPDCAAPNALTYASATGFACNTTGISISGTPSAGQVAMWTGAATLQGLTTLPTAVLPSIPASLLPGPEASSRGGVQSLTCGASNWMSSLAATTGIFSCLQPVWADISGTTLPSGLSLPSATVTATAGSAALTATVAAASSGGGLVVANNGYSSTQPVYASQGSSTTGVGFPATNAMNFIVAGADAGRLDANGHWRTGKTSAPPTVSGCGTATITSGSTDNAGEAVLSSSVTSCTISFGTAFTNTPFCLAMLDRDAVGHYGWVYSLDTATMVVHLGIATTGSINWVCMGN